MPINYPRASARGLAWDKERWFVSDFILGWLATLRLLDSSYWRCCYANLTGGRKTNGVLSPPRFAEFGGSAKGRPHANQKSRSFTFGTVRG